MFDVQDSIYYPLYSYFNKSIEEGKVPVEWKKAIVSPIFKKGKKSSPGKYRPVSLISIMCKICESIIRDKIMNYMSSNDLFTNSPYGFRPTPGRSVRTKILCYSTPWSFGRLVRINANNGQWFLNHLYYIFGLLQSVLKEVPCMLNWIKSFLTGRNQCVLINNTTSTLSDVVSGVPQGSVLDPVLFLIFINGNFTVKWQTVTNKTKNKLFF